MRWLALLACVLLLAGCGVFRDTKRDRRLDRVEASVLLDVARVDTGKRMVLERWGFDGPLPGQSFDFRGAVVDGRLDIASPLFVLKMELDSLANALSGSLSLTPSGGGGWGERLTLEQKGVAERDRSVAVVEAESKGDVRSGTASWKGVWVWLGGIALVLAFLFILIRVYVKK